MEWYRKRHIGDMLEMTSDDVTSKSIEELIDQGKRFTLAKDDELSMEDDDVPRE